MAIQLEWGLDYRTCLDFEWSKAVVEFSNGWDFFIAVLYWYVLLRFSDDQFYYIFNFYFLKWGWPNVLKSLIG